MCSSTRRAGERHTGLIARAEGLGVILRTRKTKKRSAQGGDRKKGGTRKDGGWRRVFAESAGAGAINLAGISELMNVIKIQPPAS